MKKQSKVYEASEAVDGLHVKHTKMNHKKCTPGEFGAMVKEAGSPWARMGKMVGSFMQTPNQTAQKAMLAARREFKPSAGGSAPPKTLLNPSQTTSYNRTFNALKRQGVDQDTAAFHASQAGQLHIPRRDALQAVGQDAVRAQLMRQGKTLGVGALGGAGVAGAYGYGPLALPQQAPELEVNARKPQVPSMTKTQSARDFGAMVKESVELSSTSIGQTQGGAPPGAYSGKVRLPINTPDQAIQAHAANLAAGNPVQPAQKDVPQTILAPANGSGAVPRSIAGRMLGAPGRKYDSARAGMFDKLFPPSAEALAGRHVTEVGGDYMQNSSNFGRKFVSDMATPGVYTPKPNQGGSFIKTQSARDFGAYVKRSFNISQHLPAAGVGAAAGAGLGALGGLINPGEEDEYDDQGRVVGRKQRSRFGAVLNNALMGAGVGGLAGGVGSAVAPGYTDQALQKLYGMFQKKPQPMDDEAYAAALQSIRKGAHRKLDEITLHHAPPPSTAVPTSGGKMRIHPGVRSQQKLQMERDYLPQAVRDSRNWIDSDAGLAAEPIPEISFPNAG